MLENRNILCLANPAWEGDYAKTIVELMTVFARFNRVLFVEYAFTLKDAFVTLFGKGKAPLGRMFGSESGVREFDVGQGKSIRVLTPPAVWPVNALPHGRLYRTLLERNARWVREAAQKALREHHMEDRLIVIDAFNPALGLPNVGKFHEALHLYHCYDEISAAHWVSKHGTVLEAEYIPQVDAVVTTSKGLYERKKRAAQACYYVPNGVNFSLFHQGFDTAFEAPRPVVGYIGSVDDRLDYDLLQHCFRALPELEFHFVGRIMYPAGEQILRQYPNVVLHGPQSVQQLPEYLRTFGAALIPFVKNDFTKGIYPLKINEYLAAGIPVIMTRFGQLEEFESVVAVQDEHEAFAAAIQQAVQEDTQALREARVDVARQNSWEARAEAFSQVIREVEEGKQ